MDEEDRLLSSSCPSSSAVAKPRVRSVSVGSMQGTILGDGRLQARLEASFVGLEELSLLRQTHCRAIETAKASLMANIPEEDQQNVAEVSPATQYCHGRDQTEGVTGIGDRTPNAQEASPPVQGPSVTLLTVTDASTCRKRANSMDMSVARSLALTAKVR